MKLVLTKALWVFLFFTLTIVELSVCIGICEENEQQTLEMLKKEVYDPKKFLSSWIVGKDCCEWEGVVCNNITRQVIELRIFDIYEYGGLRIGNLEWLPSLMNLKILQMYHVDLSKATNWLQVTNVLPSLIELTLHNCSLHHISPLLDHHHFSSLKILDLSLNNFSSPIPKWILSLPNLVSFHLSHSTFIGPFPEGPVNLPSLKSFSASGNSFNCPLPEWLFDLNNLELLWLANNGIKGVVSSLISNLSSIILIDLSSNELSGKLPSVIGKLRKLETLHLSDNLFEGEVSESHFTNLTQLLVFYASGNDLTLKVSQNWIPPFQAEMIKMGGWNLGPQLPLWLQTQKMITDLDISNGRIEGEVPIWFWNLSSQLQNLNISHNQFIGKVPNISTLIMDFASNNFSGPLPHIPTTVEHLDLSHNFLSGGLSHLCESNNESYTLVFLNLEGNNFSGEIPDCWMNCPGLKVIILRNNNLIGGIPRSILVLTQLAVLDVRRNRLTGPLPVSLGNFTKLRRLHLDENELDGKLPSWLGMRLSYLIILSLRSNKFHGELPPELCYLQKLQILDLANNMFFGIIPRCIGNFTTMVIGRKATEVDDELSYRSDFIPEIVRVGATVATKGHTYQYDTILALVTSIDMSNNNLSGDIPTSLTNLVALRFCNFSKNYLTGRIPKDIGDMKVLESFDLSENQLTGQIPQSFTILSTLSFLNLSNNNLSGKIPVSTQLQSFNPSSFERNQHLCGLPLLKKCSSKNEMPSLENEEEKSNEDDIDGFYISMAIGFGLSFWGLGATFIFKRSWRHAYFQFLDGKWNSLRLKLHI